MLRPESYTLQSVLPFHLWTCPKNLFFVFETSVWCVSFVLNPSFQSDYKCPLKSCNICNMRTKKEVLPGIPPKQYHLSLFRPILEAVKVRYDYPLNLCRCLTRIPESPYGSSVFGSLLFDGLLQNHVLHLYGATLLGSANISQIVPFVNDSASLFSRLVPSLHSQSQPGSGKNPAAQTASFPSGL